MHGEYEEPIIIELDDPVPRGALVGALIATIVILALIAAPFMITLPEPESTASADDQTTRATGNAQICRPEIDVPSAFDGLAGFALPSWMRMCEWFISPEPPPVNIPRQ